MVNIYFFVLSLLLMAITVYLTSIKLILLRTKILRKMAKIFARKMHLYVYVESFVGG